MLKYKSLFHGLVIGTYMKKVAVLMTSTLEKKKSLVRVDEIAEIVLFRFSNVLENKYGK